MYIEKVLDLWVQLMKNGKNKSVAFIILVAVIKKNDSRDFCIVKKFNKCNFLAFIFIKEAWKKV